MFRQRWVCFPIDFCALQIARISVAASRDGVLFLHRALLVGVFNVRAEAALLIGGIAVATLLNGAGGGELLELSDQLAVGWIHAHRLFAAGEGFIPSIDGGEKFLGLKPQALAIFFALLNAHQIQSHWRKPLTQFIH